MTLLSKLPDVGTTIFSVMSKMASDFSAINLSQGYPDYDPPEELKERLTWYINNGFNQYAPMAGVYALREQCANKVKTFYDCCVNPDSEVTITPGATEAIFCAITAVVHTGDEVLIFDPAYDCYDPAVKLAGGIPVHIDLTPIDYSIDWSEVSLKISKRTRMIIINSPHNPSGSVLGENDIAELKKLALKHDLFVLSDEVYEHFVFDGAQHFSVLRDPELAKRSFAVFSFGKTYHATGWKMGYVVAPEALSKQLRAVHQFVTFVAFTPAQHALADFMQSSPEHLTQLPIFYERKRDLLCTSMSASRFSFKPSAGSFFQVMDYSAISHKDDMEFSEWLTTSIGVAAIPMSVFYKNKNRSKRHQVRFCFCKEDKTILEAAKKLIDI
ncbi:MAG: methionine aminotransferase [Gammaproteobacteria bacterium]